MEISPWLIEGGYIWIFSIHLILSLIVSLYALFFLVKRWTIWDWFALSSLFIVFGLLLSTQNFFQAHVYNDEFYYAAIAQNIADRGIVCPLVYEGGIDQVKIYEHFQPPYPQGWPCLIGIFYKFISTLSGRPASMPMWYYGALLNKLLLIGSLAGLFVALRCWGERVSAWAVCLSLAFLPFIRALAQGASAEPAALSALVLTFLACAAYKSLPKVWGSLWLVLSAAFLVQMRPEGAVALFLALLIGGLKLSVSVSDRQLSWPMIIGGILIAILFSWPAFWAVFAHPPQLNHHFEAVARPGLTIWQNRALNILNNLLFFIKNQGWPTALTVLSLLALCWNSADLEGENNYQKPSLNRWAAALWLSLLTLFLSWYPFGDYASVYSYDSWRFAYVVIVPMAFLAFSGFNHLRWRGGKYKWIAWGMMLASFTPYLGCASAIKLNPMQDDYDRFMFQAVQLAACNGVPLVVPDTHLFCDAVYRWGGQVYIENKLLDAAGLLSLGSLTDQAEQKGELGGAKDTNLMVVCLYKSSDNTYNLEFWEGWEVTLLAEEAHIKAGLFLFKKDK
ncbi:MAG: hypothetical protein ACI376_07390 [Candidatus Bruticola sp.]